MPAQGSTQTPQQANALARSVLLNGGLAMLQPIAGGSLTVTPSQQNQVQITVPPVGFARGVWVQVTATIANTDGAVNLALTDWGPANLLQSIVLRDLQSYERINIPGWQLAFLNAVKGRKPFGSSLIKGTGEDSPINFGSNWTVQSAPATINHGTSGTLTYWYYVPIAYSAKDLRGGIFAATTSAQIRLILNINQTPLVAAGDSSLAVYSGTVSGSITSLTVNTFYDYIDQLPVGSNGQPILPLLDLSTMYELKNTYVQLGIPQNADFAIQIPNQRSFLSFMVLYYNGANRTAGTDINYLARRTANITDIFHCPPSMIAAITRTILGVDPPPGFYYLDSREVPVSTRTFGNQSIIINPNTTGTPASAYVTLGWEAFAALATINQAASLTQI